MEDFKNKVISPLDMVVFGFIVLVIDICFNLLDGSSIDTATPITLVTFGVLLGLIEKAKGV